jgi:hypothetical protein
MRRRAHERPEHLLDALAKELGMHRCHLHRRPADHRRPRAHAGAGTPVRSTRSKAGGRNGTGGVGRGGGGRVGQHRTDRRPFARCSRRVPARSGLTQERPAACW